MNQSAFDGKPYAVRHQLLEKLKRAIGASAPLQ